MPIYLTCWKPDMTDKEKATLARLTLEYMERKSQLVADVVSRCPHHLLPILQKMIQEKANETDH